MGIFRKGTPKPKRLKLSQAWEVAHLENSNRNLEATLRDIERKALDLQVEVQARRAKEIQDAKIASYLSSNSKVNFTKHHPKAEEDKEYETILAQSTVAAQQIKPEDPWWKGRCLETLCAKTPPTKFNLYKVELDHGYTIELCQLPKGHEGKHGQPGVKYEHLKYPDPIYVDGSKSAGFTAH